MENIFGPGEKELSKLRGVSFSVRKGEILGIAGVNGNGQSELAEAIAYAGEKKNPRYVNGILRAWYTKGYKTVRDVIADSAGTMQNVQRMLQPCMIETKAVH